MPAILLFHAVFCRYVFCARIDSEEFAVAEVFMYRVKKILAPTDFSDLSIAGIRYALETARDASAEVLVYHVIDLGSTLPDSRASVGPYRDMLENSRRVLDRFLAEHFADCIDLVEVRQAVELGAPYKNIVEKAAEEGVDMIVMSTHGRTGVDPFILGSVAEKVIARAPCPVLVVPRWREMETAKAA
jgi:universal stress protein A